MFRLPSAFSSYLYIYIFPSTEFLEDCEGDAGDWLGGDVFVLRGGASEESLVGGRDQASVVELQRDERRGLEPEIVRLSSILERCDKMEHFPVEICQGILENLDFPDIKAIRLTSQLWATIGREYLIPLDFTALPQRDDMSRLLSISQNSKLSYRIQALSINLGEVNEYQFRHNFFFETYALNDNAKAQLHEEVLGAYREFKALSDQYLPRSCEQKRLNTIFLGLPNLRTVHVRITASPFSHPKYPDLLRSAWTAPATRLLPQVATTERFTNILTAIVGAKGVNTIQTLSHDCLPFEFFSQKPLNLPLLSTAFLSLTSLALSLEYSYRPNALAAIQAFQNLSQSLRSASKLKELTLAFQSRRRKILISPLLSSFKTHNFNFPHLEILVLEGFAVRQIELGDFLVSQRALKRLRLGGDGVHARHEPANGGVHITEGTFRDLFTMINRDMALESFEIMGDCVGRQSGEKWVLDVAVEERNLREYVID